MAIKTQSGFTIIESLVALSILVMVIISASSAVSTGISSYIYSKDQITAFYLAQEGFEQIRNIRDENNLEGAHWLSGITEVANDPCYFGQACTVSPVETTLAIRCPAPGSCSYLRQEVATGFYGYNGIWPLTVFKREITITSVSANEISVKVTINWSKGSATRQFTVSENIHNWRSD